MAEDQRQLGQVPPAEKRMLQRRRLTPFNDIYTAAASLNANIKVDKWGSL